MRERSRNLDLHNQKPIINKTTVFEKFSWRNLISSDCLKILNNGIAALQLMNYSGLSIVQLLMDVDMISKMQTYTDNRTVQEFIEE